MLTEINGTIQIASDKVVLVVKEDDYEEFKKYEHPADSKKFYADFSLNDRQLYVTGFFTEAETAENQKDTTVTMLIASVNKVANAKASTAPADIKVLLGLDDEKKEVKIQMLQHPKKQVEELKSKVQELGAEKKKAEGEAKAQVEELNTEINTLTAQIEEQKQQVDTLAEEKAKAQVEELNTEITALKAQNTQDAAQLKAKDEEITQLKAQDEEINKLNDQVQQLEKAKQALEAKNKTTEQPKQSNAALYTAIVGVGLAAGLIAFTALERTVRLEMLVMIGIAVASALVAGGITYAALPSTQVDEAKAQEVNKNGKSK